MEFILINYSLTYSSQQNQWGSVQPPVKTINTVRHSAVQLKARLRQR